MKTIAILAAVAGIGTLAYLTLASAGDTSTAAPSKSVNRGAGDPQPSPAPSPAPARPASSARPSLAEASAPGIEEPGTPEHRGEQSERRKRRLERFDTDGDGELSTEEREAMRDSRNQRRRDRMLERFDQDGDGELDEGERAERTRAFEERRQRRTERLLVRADTDGDGVLSRDEVNAGGRRLQGIAGDFESADRNGDSVVSADELQQAMNERHQRRRRSQGRRDR